jgi:hypothetical protein
MTFTLLITGLCFFILSLYAKKRVKDKLYDAYHNNDSYGQGRDYKKAKDYTALIKLFVLLGFFCIAFAWLSR